MEDKGQIEIRVSGKIGNEPLSPNNYDIREIRIKGRQNIRSGELDMSSLELLDMKQYDPSFNEQYLARLIKKATPKWHEIDDVDEWVNKIRGVNGF